MEKKLFDFCIGNPPYQAETAELKKDSSNGQTPKKNVFHFLQMAADEVTNDTSVMIYPGGRWIQRSGKGMAEFGLNQINSKELSKVYFYPNSRELFPNAAIPDGITIVIKNHKKQKQGFDYIYCENGNQTMVHIMNPGDNILPLNPKDLIITQKIEDFVSKNHLPYMHDRILPRSLFGIESNFAEQNATKVRLLDSVEMIDYSKEIKLFTNDKAGKAGRATWFVANKDVIQNNQEYITKWKVVVSSANAGGQKRDNQLEIIDNHSAFGRSRVALAAFDTQDEAENYFSYTKSYIIRYSYLLTDEALTTLGLKVPDIIDYTNKNTYINFEDDIDTQLCNLMGLSDIEFQYVKDTVESIRRK